MRIESGGGAPLSLSKVASSKVFDLYRLIAQPTPKTRSLKRLSEAGFQ